MNKPSRKTKRIEKKIAKLQSKLNGEKAPKETKAEKKSRHATRWAVRLQKLRGLRPLNLKCVKWYEKRLMDKANGKVEETKPYGDGIVGGDVATA
jgi:hypothetical protein